ncbi:MAG TPA: sugar O-acetyltransferase [Chloroflexota bacterium]|nr:sugar O-acetyltransferase [Chloroflexota bacterium]
MAERSERERMLSGELYLAADPELVAMRVRARQLTQSYNSTSPEEAERRLVILRELLGAVGPGVEIELPFHCDYGGNIYAGKRLYLNFGCVVLDCARVRIGDDVQCGPYVQILTAHHPMEPEARLSGRELASPIRIGNNVWIGAGAVICPGVTIGDGTTIGAGSIVTRDLPANVLAVGNPCRVVRPLAAEEDLKEMP